MRLTALSSIIFFLCVASAQAAAEVYDHPRTVEAFIVAKILFGYADGRYEMPTVYNEKIHVPAMLAYYHVETNSISMDIEKARGRDSPDDMLYYLLVHEIAHSILQQDGTPPKEHHSIIYPKLACGNPEVADFGASATAYLGNWTRDYACDWD